MKDAGSFRLVCRRFDVIGAFYTLQEIKFYLSEADFDMLRSIANNPTTRHFVRSLVYVADMLPLRLLDFREYSEYVTTRCEKDRQGQNTDEAFPALEVEQSGFHEGYSMTPLRDYNRQKKDVVVPTAIVPFEHHVENGYRKYRQLFNWQKHTLEHGADRQFLEEVLPAFSNVKHVTVASSTPCLYDSGFEWLNGVRVRNGRYEGWPLSRASCPLVPLAFPALNACVENSNKPHATSLMSALRSSRSITLHTLRTSSVGYSILHQFGAQVMDPAMVRLCGSLSEFELIATMPTVFDNDDAPSVAVITECDDITSTGILRSMLLAMPKLRELRLELEIPHSHGYHTSFSQVIEPGFKWHHLHKVELHGLQAHQKELLAFIRCHKDTIGQHPDNPVWFHNLKLCNSSWLVFLPLLRGILRETGVNIWLTGDAVGVEEDSGREEWWTLRYEHDEDYQAGNDPENPAPLLGYDVVDYVEGYIDDCPLSRDNMENWEEEP